MLILRGVALKHLVPLCSRRIERPASYLSSQCPADRFFLAHSTGVPSISQCSVAQPALHNLDFGHLRHLVPLGAFQRQLRPR